MQKVAIVILSVFIVLGYSCSKSAGFKKTSSGLLYKIISNEKGPVVKRGEFIKVDYSQKIRDSVLATSIGSMPIFQNIDSIGPVFSPLEVFPMLRKGDSLVVVMLGDSIFKKQGQLPPFMTRKDNITFTFKVLDVFSNEEAVKVDYEKSMEQQKEKEIRAIEQFLAEKNIKAQRTEKGTYVEIQDPGNGPSCDSGKAVYVKYRGMTLANVEFDSNLNDTAYPRPIILGSTPRRVIEGWDDGLRLFKKGGKGRLFIPSTLAYGGNPPPGSPFKPFENLQFEISIVDVTEAPKQAMPMGMPQQPSPR